MQTLLESLRREVLSLSKADRTDFLLKRCPLGSDCSLHAMRLLNGIEISKAERLRAVRYYLQGMPFSSEQPYVFLLSAVSAPVFAKEAMTCFPADPERAGLATYYLRPLLLKSGVLDQAEPDTDLDRFGKLLAQIEASF